MPYKVIWCQVYHDGSLETNVIEPNAEGAAGLAYGLVWAGKCSI